MTNAPKTRKTHVIRILGTNKNEDILPDLWADVERIDEAKSVYQSDLTSFQGTVKRLKWSDDPDQDDYNPDGTPSRKTKIVKVCSPDEADQSDPEEWIPIPVIDKMRGLQGDQGEVERFINDQETGARKVEQRRILHYDTNIDDKAQAAFDADPTRKAFVVPGDQYTRDDDTKDDSQFLEHEIITFLKGRVNNETGTGQGDDQGKQTKLLNQYLIDESEEAKLEVMGENGFNPPWRLDPYQNIVNVQLAGATEFLWTPTNLSQVPISDGAVQISSTSTPDSFRLTYSAFVQIKRSGNGAGTFMLFQAISNQASNDPALQLSPEWSNIVQALQINVSLNPTTGTASFDIQIESRAMDLNPYVVDVGVPYSAPPSSDGDPVPIIAAISPLVCANKVKLNYNYNSDQVPLSEVSGKPFHIYITIDTSTPMAVTPTSVEFIPNSEGGGSTEFHQASDFLTSAQFDIWLNNRQISVSNARSIGPDSLSIFDVGTVNDCTATFNITTAVTASDGTNEHGTISNATSLFDIVTQTKDVEIFITHDPDTKIPVTQHSYWQVPVIPGQKIVWNGMAVGVPFAFAPIEPLTVPDGELTDSITMQAVQVWTNQVINPSNIPQYFIDDNGNSRPVAVAQARFGAATYVLDGTPKTFAANKNGSGPALGQFGTMKSHKRLRQ